MTENRRIYVDNLFGLWILQLHGSGPVMSTFDSSTVCVFGENSKQMRLDDV